MSVKVTAMFYNFRGNLLCQCLYLTIDVDQAR
jgi:hypothetical protein